MRSASEAGWHDDRWPTPEPPERFPIEVIRVRMRDQHDVDVAETIRLGHGSMPFQWSECRPEEGIGQDAHAGDLEQHGRVPHEPDVAYSRHRKAGRIRRKNQESSRMHPG